MVDTWQITLYYAVLGIRIQPVQSFVGAERTTKAAHLKCS